MFVSEHTMASAWLTSTAAVVQTTLLSWYQKDTTSLDFTEARHSGNVAVVSTRPHASLHPIQTDNHASSFFTGQMPFLSPNQQQTNHVISSK